MPIEKVNLRYHFKLVKLNKTQMALNMPIKTNFNILKDINPTHSIIQDKECL